MKSELDRKCIYRHLLFGQKQHTKYCPEAKTADMKIEYNCIGFVLLQCNLILYKKGSFSLSTHLKIHSVLFCVDNVLFFVFFFM